MSVFKFRSNNKHRTVSRVLLDFYFYNIYYNLQKIHYGKKTLYIVEEEWDNLIILDACRFDMFKKYNPIKGKLESRYSKGSWTVEFLLNNFKYNPTCNNFKDIIYVTANPYVNKYVNNAFFKIYSTWINGWDDDMGTVFPDAVILDALLAKIENPDKRLIIHFLQPHYPFLNGDPKYKLSANGIKFFALGEKDEWLDKEKVYALEKSPWYLLEQDIVRLEPILKGYVYNLKTVLQSIKQLVNKLEGFSVITSDHGNLFGEIPHVLFPFKVFGHWAKLYSEKTLKVPWLKVEH